MESQHSDSISLVIICFVSLVLMVAEMHLLILLLKQSLLVVCSTLATSVSIDIFSMLIFSIEKIIYVPALMAAFSC